MTNFLLTGHLPSSGTAKSLFTSALNREKQDKKKEEKPQKKKKTAPVRLKSGVDLNAASKDGRTAAHFCVAPVEGASFNNLELLKLLHRNGMRIDESVVELAASAQNGSQEMLEALKGLKVVLVVE